MAKGKLTISIDLALAWSVWDTLTAEELRLAETAERPICAALIELLDRYEVPATSMKLAPNHARVGAVRACIDAACRGPRFARPDLR